MHIYVAPAHLAHSLCSRPRYNHLSTRRLRYMRKTNRLRCLQDKTVVDDGPADDAWQEDGNFSVCYCACMCVSSCVFLYHCMCFNLLRIVYHCVCFNVYFYPLWMLILGPRTDTTAHNACTVTTRLQTQSLTNSQATRANRVVFCGFYSLHSCASFDPLLLPCTQVK